MVAHGGHVRDVGGDGLDLTHETVADAAVVLVEVVREVADVQYGVVDAPLDLFLFDFKIKSIKGYSMGRFFQHRSNAAIDRPPFGCPAQVKMVLTELTPVGDLSNQVKIIFV